MERTPGAAAPGFFRFRRARRATAQAQKSRASEVQVPKPVATMFVITLHT